MSSLGQNLQDRVHIRSVSDSDFLITSKSNIIIIQGIDGLSNINLETSQGRYAISSDSTFYMLDSLKAGTVTIRVFKLTGRKNNLVTHKKFTVRSTDSQKRYDTIALKPTLTIENYAPGKITVSEVKNSKQFLLSDQYKLINASVYFTGPNGTDTQVYSVATLKFSDELEKVWRYLKGGFSVSIQATIINQKEVIIELPMISYTVSES